MASYNLNEILKRRASGRKSDPEHMDLGDTARVKVLSPMRQVMKRFMRNRLAIFGSCVLIFMFVFSFVGPIFYPYAEDQTLYTFSKIESQYSFVQARTEYTGYLLNDEIDYNRSVATKTNSNINMMESKGLTSLFTLVKDGMIYELKKEGPGIYTLSQSEPKKVAAFGEGLILVGNYNGISKTVSYEHESLGAEFEAAAAENCKGKGGEFEFNGKTYTFEPGSAKKTFDIFAEPEEGFRYYGEALDAGFEAAAQTASAGDVFSYGGIDYALTSPEEGSFEVYALDEGVPFMVYTQFGFDTYVTSLPLSAEFKAQALFAAYGSGTFEAERVTNPEAIEQAAAAAAAKAAEEAAEKAAAGEEAEETAAETEAAEAEEPITLDLKYTTDTFTVTPSAEHEGVLVVTASDGTPYAELNTLVVRRYNGDDTMELDLKYAIRGVVQEMMESGAETAKVTHRIPEQTDDGKNKYDEDGVLQFEESEMTVTRRSEGEYVVKAMQTRYLIDKYASPTSKHWLGTDGNGFDVLARIMYGGRISLLVGFVVVFIETLLGIIMGGLAGFFGGWVDNIIMRLVDIFYCLPFMPIMIIVGALMDASRMHIRLRLFVLMAAMGVMGWASIARLVRGQILSLREQEFMTAAEATGLPTGRRIFRHLVPNVMPQLIVSATMGLGSTILAESTLSFLGLGVKHPMATWGSMINSVSSAAAMEQYAYIWIPVGLLICFTVIAFNFVGDGLRDAFDPKGKR